MKPELVKILSFVHESYEYFESNGGVYKTKRQGDRFFGLGNDGKIYKYGIHSFYDKDEKTYLDHTGWHEVLECVRCCTLLMVLTWMGHR